MGVKQTAAKLYDLSSTPKLYHSGTNDVILLCAREAGMDNEDTACILDDNERILRALGL